MLNTHKHTLFWCQPNPIKQCGFVRQWTAFACASQVLQWSPAFVFMWQVVSDEHKDGYFVFGWVWRREGDRGRNVCWPNQTQSISSMRRCSSACLSRLQYSMFRKRKSLLKRNSFHWSNHFRSYILLQALLCLYTEFSSVLSHVTHSVEHVMWLRRSTMADQPPTISLSLYIVHFSKVVEKINSDKITSKLLRHQRCTHTYTLEKLVGKESGSFYIVIERSISNKYQCRRNTRVVAKES